MTEKQPAIAIAGMSPGKQLLAAIICLLVVFVVTYPVLLLIGRIAGADMKALADAVNGLGVNPASIKYLQFAQHFSLFILPVLVWSYLSGGGLTRFTGLNIPPKAGNITLVILVSLLLFPVNSYTTFLNSQMTFPDWMNGLEQWMQSKEQQGEFLTSLMIVSETIPVLIINIFILALIPALGEEFFFRGLLQRQLKLIIGMPHLTVFITAFIFSSLHLQFYGFLPRFILGLVYGYLYLWSRSVWLPAIAHFINNAVPVVLTYFYGWERVSNGSMETVTEWPVFPVLSIVAVIMLMVYASKVLPTDPASRPT